MPQVSPAPGVRYFAYGTLHYIGSGGYNWASSVSTGRNADFLYFNAGGIGPNGDANRAYGFQVRCLQE